MVVGIAGGNSMNPAHLQLIDELMESLIEDSGCYLFTMFSAGIEGSEYTHPPLALQYSQLRGLPCSRKTYPTFDTLVKGICKEVDYLIILNDGSPPIKRCMMSFMQTGKHGTEIKL